jgi:hypothetical protein
MIWFTLARSKGKYLFPVKAMSKVFRAKYADALKARLLIKHVASRFRNKYSSLGQKKEGYERG